MPVIATNTAANTALIALNRNSQAMDESLSKLSSGSNIVRASDDAAGLAVSTSLQSDISTFKQAAINVVQARSVLQTADGSLARVGDILMRMKSLATASISGSISNTERSFIQSEYSSLFSENINIGFFTAFNEISLLDGTYNQSFQMGPSATTDVINLNLSSVNLTSSVYLNTVFGVASASFAILSSGFIDVAFDQLSSDRALVGSYLSRFETRGDVIDTSLENLVSAKSSIVDADIAAEQTNLVSMQVLTEASIASLAQANKMKSDLLTLVR